MLGTAGTLILLVIVFGLVVLDIAVLALSSAGRVKDRTVTVILIGSMVTSFASVGIAAVVAA